MQKRCWHRSIVVEVSLMLQSSASPRQTEPSWNTSKTESMFLAISKTSSTTKAQVCLHPIHYCRGNQFSSITKLSWSFKTFTLQLYTFAELYLVRKETDVFLNQIHRKRERGRESEEKGEMGFRHKPWISMQHVGGKSELQCTKTWEKERRYRQTALQSRPPKLSTCSLTYLNPNTIKSNINLWVAPSCTHLNPASRPILIINASALSNLKYASTSS